MPIRMEKDDPRDKRDDLGPQEPRRPRRGLGSLGKLLPFLLLFIFKKPKLLIPVLIVAAFWYFFLGGNQMFNGSYEEADSNFFFGASLNEEMYDKAEVFEPLATTYAGLPPAVSLKQYAPRPLHQGRQGSCVGWASAYGARTILHSRATGQDPNRVAFSPAYLYNQIALTGCQGAYMLDAMKSLYNYGALPFSQFGYDERSCSNAPNSNQRNAGQQYRIKGYNRLTLGANNYRPDIDGIKQNLAQGAPVVIGMQVGGTFMSRMVGQKIWRPTNRDYNMSGFGGHAMCVIGYDDNLEGGAFQILNSWSEDWGDRGFAWVRYKDFDYFVKEAYGLYPMGSSDKFDKNKLAVEFGLVNIESQQAIALRKEGDLVFRTQSPIAKGDKFKILIANSVECYTYVFGKETDGSSYVLFPYTSKHSAYCGITGTRLFPRDYSMKADEIGNTDEIAIVVSKEPLDFNVFNQRINNAGGGWGRNNGYVEKLVAALGNQRIENVNFQAGQTVAFQTATQGKNAVGMVIRIDKR